MKKYPSRQAASQKGKAVRSQGKGKRKKKDDSRLVGFKTLQQVAGGPKPHAFHSRIPVPDLPSLSEPHDECAICGERIDSIAESFYTDSGKPAHFDCVLEHLRKENRLEEGQKLSYCGSGAFGIWQKDEEGKWSLVRKIPFEDAETYGRMKAYVRENMA